MEPRMLTRGTPNPNPRRSGRKRRVGLDASSSHEESKKEKILAKVFDSMKSDALEVIEKLTKFDFAAPFLEPVDATKPGCEIYYTMIKDPMDFSTVKSKMEQRLYGSLDEWIDDIRQIFINCYTYNQAGSEICNYAGALSIMFERELAGLRDKEDELAEEAELAEMKLTMQQLYEEQAKMMMELGKLKYETENPSPVVVYQQPAPVKKSKVPQKKKKKSPAPVVKKPAQPTFSKKRKTDLTRNLSIISQGANTQHLEGLVPIVASELNPQNQAEFEIDLDTLSVPTLLKLEAYVNQCLGLKASSGPSNGVRRKKLHPEDFDGDAASNFSPRGGEDSSSSSDESEGELDVVF